MASSSAKPLKPIALIIKVVVQNEQLRHDIDAINLAGTRYRTDSHGHHTPPQTVVRGLYADDPDSRNNDVYRSTNDMFAILKDTTIKI